MTPTLPSLLPGLTQVISLVSLTPYLVLAIPFIALGLVGLALAWAMRA